MAVTQNIPVQRGSIIHGRISEYLSQVEKKVLGLPLSSNTLYVYLHMLFYTRHYTYCII